MRCCSFLLVVGAAVILVGCSKVSVVPGVQRPDEAPEISWSYEGATGPAAWASQFPACGGSAQSPVDVEASAIAVLPALEIEYTSVGGTLIDTGRALHVETEGGALTIGDSLYTLLRVEFHLPSEHTIGGRRFDGEMQFVHADAYGGTAVIAIPLTTGEENEFIDDVLEAAAAPRDEWDSVEIDVEDVEPAAGEYYTYVGSLTTPPCTEGVRWYVLPTPISLSGAQLRDLAAHYWSNARPLQPLNDRPILHHPE